MLTGCAVALVGAVGAAGVSSIDRGPEGSHDESTIVIEPPPVNKSYRVKVVDGDIASPALPIPSSEVANQTLVPETLVVEQIQTNKPPSGKLLNKVVSDTSARHLASHAWKIIGINGVKDLNFKSTDSVFIFASNSEFKAFISCNYVSGKFEADDAGRFFLGKLNSSNKICAESKDQEVLIESMLLSANEFFINDQALILSSNGKPVLAFDAAIKRLDLAGFVKVPRQKNQSKKINRLKSGRKVNPSQKVKLKYKTKIK